LSNADKGTVGFILAWELAILTIILYNILHISHLGTNLISLGALHYQGVSVRSLDNSLVLSKDSKELF